MNNEFFDATPAGTKKIVRGWLLLAVFSLVFAGIFALLVALARTPVIETMLPLGRDYIFVALVGHVVLAVVIWFLAFEGFLWAYSTSVLLRRGLKSEIAGWLSLALSSAGMLLVVISAIFGLGFAELANYVPVLGTPVFYVGLGLFAVGVFVNIINGFLSFFAAKTAGVKLRSVTVGMAASSTAVLVAFLCFALSGYFQYSTGKAYLDFERLFWGGGHMLQFANTIAMVTVWAFIAYIVYGRQAVSSAVSKPLYALYLFFVLPAPIIYFIHDTATQAHKESFTTLMQWGLGFSTAVFMLMVIALMVSQKSVPMKRPAFSSLVLSMIIFAVGGVLALTISGVNTIIPAHYHSVIGAVTIAFMGLFYEMAPVFGKAVYSKKMAAVQPYLYFTGILLFAIGLYIAGSHGVARKTYAGAQNLNSWAKIIGMSVMGIGGLVSIAGGITFVVNALATLLKSGATDATLPSAFVVEKE
ncbi:hypothetical protein EPN18_01470 [bacterium]|nr:MAG: hypothetical protein EPN18_01470 [bacterium]